jgi:hypothetical protein
VLTDGRPAIYIGKFDDVSDKVAHLQMIHLVILELLKLAKKATESGGGGLLDSYKHKVAAMRRSFHETKEDMDEHGKKMKQYQRQQKKLWDELEISWVGFVSKFGLRLARALKDDDEDEESCDEELAAAKELVAAKEAAVVPVVSASPPVVRPVAETHLSAAVSPYADVKAAAPEVVALPPLAVGPPTIAASTAAAAPVKKHKIADDRKRLQALWTEHKVQPGNPVSDKLDILRKGLREAGVAF